MRVKAECPVVILVKMTCSLRMSEEWIGQGAGESIMEYSSLMRGILCH